MCDRVLLVLKAHLLTMSHVLGSCVETNALRMDRRFSTLPFTDIRALYGPDQTVAMFVRGG
jgi:hypothetical protein